MLPLVSSTSRRLEGVTFEGLIDLTQALSGLIPPSIRMGLSSLWELAWEQAQHRESRGSVERRRGIVTDRTSSGLNR